MNAAVFIAPRAPFEIRDYPLADPAPGMASVLLEASGLCGTDVHIWEGALAMAGPMILGHEFLGRIQALGDGPRVDCFGAPLAPGDLVVQIGNIRVKGMAEFLSAAMAYRLQNNILLGVVRGGRLYYARLVL